MVFEIFFICALGIFCIIFPNAQALLHEHHNDVVEVKGEERTIKHNKVEPTRSPTSGGGDSRADEEQDIHIKTQHNTNSAHCIDRSGDVSDIKLIGLVELEVFDEFLEHCFSLFLFLSVFIIPQNPSFVKGFCESFLIIFHAGFGEGVKDDFAFFKFAISKYDRIVFTSKDNADAPFAIAKVVDVSVADFVDVDKMLFDSDKHFSFPLFFYLHYYYSTL